MGSIGNNQVSGPKLGQKTYIDDTSSYYKYNAYAGKLADDMVGKPVYRIEYNGKEAIANASEGIHADELYIITLSSTGGGAGTELLARLAEDAYDKGIALSWVADNNDAKKYYSHLQVNKFGEVITTPQASEYRVDVQNLRKFARHLRERRR